MKKRLLKTIKIIALFIIILFVVLAAIVLSNRMDEAVITKRVKNENLLTIKSDWQGTPVDQNGRFVNAEFAFLSRTVDLLRWQLSGNPQKAEKQADTAQLEIEDPAEFLNSERDGVLWLGHATVFVRLNGIGVLLDPIFGKPPFVKTFTEVPPALDKIKRVDYILISHDHRDHCDETSIKQTAEKFPEARILGGLGMEDLFNDWKMPSNETQTAGWYQQFSLSDERLKITFLPVRHWSRRGLFDMNRRLWGAFVVEGAGKTVYFGGDSGYGSHYKELHEVFPRIDYFVVGIGAYSPRWFMKPNHNSPEDAFAAFVDSKAQTLIPIHYGTFNLSDEPPSEPLRLLREAAEKSSAIDKIKVLPIGGSLDF
ncbi:MAG TPA: MBL fold metallo-hydrolase [Pyrinomonadaceae bacterium]|nr:MBL fold metallo-hydrolase [Pyrinomonadaceae bacterium]